jgi:hypothetical protein
MFDLHKKRKRIKKEKYGKIMERNQTKRNIPITLITLNLYVVITVKKQNKPSNNFHIAFLLLRRDVFDK